MAIACVFARLDGQDVARKVYSRFPASALLRHHAHPRQHKFAELIECAANMGIQVGVERALRVFASVVSYGLAEL